MTRSVNWKLWVGLLISALFVYLALRQVDASRLWLVIRSADPVLFAVVILITLFQYVIRAWRWAILLEPLKKTGFVNRLHAIIIGFAANCILPARLGEFIRANYLGQAEKISGSSSFGTVVVERLFDGFTLLLILLIGLLGTHFPPEWRPVSAGLRATGFVLFFSYTALIVFLVGFKVKAEPFLNLLDRILFFIPRHLRSRIVNILWNFSRGLVLTREARRWVFAVFYSFLLWFLSLIQIQLVEHAIGLRLPMIVPFMVMAMASFGVMIPSAPGFIGTFHLSVQYGFLFYGVAKEEALSAAILWHATFFFPTLFFGFFSFLFFQTSLSSMSHQPDVSQAKPISEP